MRFGQLILTPTEVRHTAADNTCTAITDPAALRHHVRENPFRPLVTLDNLPEDWRVPVVADDTLPAIVETIYPGTLADWALNGRGELHIGSLEEVSSRQVGMFRGIHETSPDIVQENIQALCDHCVRHATWYYGRSPEDTIPCPEPCNLWLSRVKETIAL